MFYAHLGVLSALVDFILPCLCTCFQVSQLHISVILVIAFGHLDWPTLTRLRALLLGSGLLILTIYITLAIHIDTIILIESDTDSICSVFTDSPVCCSCLAYDLHTCTLVSDDEGHARHRNPITGEEAPAEPTHSLGLFLDPSAHQTASAVGEY